MILSSKFKVYMAPIENESSFISILNKLLGSAGWIHNLISDEVKTTLVPWNDILQILMC
jgi:hypothetical protein